MRVVYLHEKYAVVVTVLASEVADTAQSLQCVHFAPMADVEGRLVAVEVDDNASELMQKSDHWMALLRRITSVGPSPGPCFCLGSTEANNCDYLGGLGHG
jgi:hypothetical protein